MTDLAILILRIAVGVAMIGHGAYKFTNKRLFDQKWQDDYGFPRGSVLFAGVVQIAGGAAIIGGVFSRIAALILLLLMLVATYVCIAKHREPFLSTPDGKGWDINFLLMASLVALILLGGGKWSLTGW